jgi:hypothetical protein
MRLPAGVELGDNWSMRQLQLFTGADIAVMRDRTRSRNHSPGRDDFRRMHERHRAWGLARRHARKLRRLASIMDDAAVADDYRRETAVSPAVQPSEVPRSEPVSVEAVGVEPMRAELNCPGMRPDSPTDCISSASGERPTDQGQMAAGRRPDFAEWVASRASRRAFPEAACEAPPQSTPSRAGRAGRSSLVGNGPTPAIRPPRGAVINRTGLLYRVVHRSASSGRSVNASAASPTQGTGWVRCWWSGMTLSVRLPQPS